jgi:lipopolysaccharide export LptBFGC system permease protein LptF
LRYLKKLLRPFLGFAFLISVGGYIFGFNVAPGPPTLLRG